MILQSWLQKDVKETETLRIIFAQSCITALLHYITKDVRKIYINIILGSIQLCKTEKRKSWKSNFLWHLFVTHYAKSHLGTIFIKYMYDYFATCICKINGRLMYTKTILLYHASWKPQVLVHKLQFVEKQTNQFCDLTLTSRISKK